VFSSKVRPLWRTIRLSCDTQRKAVSLSRKVYAPLPPYANERRFEDACCDELAPYFQDPVRPFATASLDELLARRRILRVPTSLPPTRSTPPT